MKSSMPFKLALLLIGILPVFFSACVKEHCTVYKSYTYFLPIYKTKQEVRNNIRSNTPKEIENPGKLYIYGNFIFLNEKDKGIHVIDNSNPALPRKIAFIDIPGNLDLAVKGNSLYADLYTDMVTIDITNPASVVLKKVTPNLFPFRYWGGGYVGNNTDLVITDWIKKDTTVAMDCRNNDIITLSDQVFFGGGISSSAASSPIGRGGSMARFTIVNNRLYTVSSTYLDVFNITNNNDPVHVYTTSVGREIETIYPFNNSLFIGSMNGMYIYGLANPDAPLFSGQFLHARVCDPVIADNSFAYVTLRSGTPCQGFANELDILSINDLTNPVLLKSYPLNNPHGLSKDGNYLFICDGTDGLKIFEASDVNNLQLLKKINGINTFDVIAYDKKALVVASDGLYQYDYADINNVRLISKLTISN